MARELLGVSLVRVFPDQTTVSGYINETEAYIGTEDLGCHAKAGRTSRNEFMWGPPGHLYVYFNYGMHWLMNLVTEEDGFPAAVLIRGMIPHQGLDRIRENRKGRPRSEWTNGPAKLCQALEIDGQFDGLDVCSSGGTVFLSEGLDVDVNRVVETPRIGLNNVPEPWKSKPWRFHLDLAEGECGGAL